jgi:16S rRNA (adenine1518-N6/adenine1519-N6)-dimethyltransferase
MAMKKRKSLGQHFLKDDHLSWQIAAAIDEQAAPIIVEIGPGAGALTRHLLDRFGRRLWCIELDERFAHQLPGKFPELDGQVLQKDFLRWNPDDNLGDSDFVLTGNFPYYISTEILFRALDMRNRIPQVVGMFQREVAERVAAPPGNKQYGVTSVLLTAFYRAELLFSLPPEAFDPPPKVYSAVLRLTRLDEPRIQSDYKDYRRVVKTAFSQRRKTLRNALASLLPEGKVLPEEIGALRAERLSVEEFDQLTQWILA